MLRLAIVGAGWAGERQLQAVRELGRKISVTCLVDRDADFLAEKAAQYGITKTYTDYEAVLQDPEIDAVSICTPHMLHCEMAVAAARAHKHILCEKPIALTLDDADRMIATAHEHKVRLYVAENWSYTPVAHFLRDALQSGRYTGNLVHVSGVFGFQAQNFGYPGRRDWLTLPERGGTGTWMLHGIHTIAQIRYIFGEITTIYAADSRAPLTRRTDIEASISALMRLQSGATFSLLQTSEVKITDQTWGYTIYGDSGTLHAGAESCTISGTENGDPHRVLAYPSPALSDYAQEMEAFADYVLDGHMGPTSGESERQSLAVILAGYRSMQSGKPVVL